MRPWSVTLSLGSSFKPKRHSARFIVNEDAPMEITRLALYEALWSTPRKDLAADWGLSSNTLTFASKKQDIPLPKPGHWTSVSMGKSPSQPALTGDPDETVILED